MRSSGRLTYANVVATLALFMALGGVSYAAITITGKNVKNGSLTGTDVKNKSLTKKDFRGSVRGATGATGQQGPPGLAGAPGAAGSALAYAYIRPNGLLDLTRSKNVRASARNPDFPTGVYCLDVNFTPKNAVATLVRDEPATAPLIVEVKVPPNGNSCQAGFETLVVVSNLVGAFVDKAVMVNIN